MNGSPAHTCTSQCKPLLFLFSCKRRYINVLTFNLYSRGPGLAGYEISHDTKVDWLDSWAYVASCNPHSFLPSPFFLPLLLPSSSSPLSLSPSLSPFPPSPHLPSPLFLFFPSLPFPFPAAGVWESAVSSKSGIFTNNYWVGLVGQSNFLQVSLAAFFRALSKYFSGKNGSAT